MKFIENFKRELQFKPKAIMTKKGANPATFSHIYTKYARVLALILDFFYGILCLSKTPNSKIKSWFVCCIF
jgi:hypothetical protein